MGGRTRTCFLPLLESGRLTGWLTHPQKCQRHAVHVKGRPGHLPGRPLVGTCRFLSRGTRGDDLAIMRPTLIGARR